MEGNPKVWKRILKSTLGSDIHSVMRQKESTLRNYIGQSPQLHLRRYLVDWLLTLSEKRFNLEPTTVHLAIYLLDHFMDQYDIQDKTIYLVALVSLFIAIKMEEDNKVPKISELNYCINDAFTLKEFAQMELMLLRSFCFNLVIPTSSHFMDYYITLAVTPEDMKQYIVDSGLEGNEDILFEKARSNMKKHVAYFLEISLQSTSYRRTRCSQVAAACVAASRICLKLKPTWTLELMKLTKYQWDDLQTCVKMLLSSYNSDMQAEKEAQKEANCIRGAG